LTGAGSKRSISLESLYLRGIYVGFIDFPKEILAIKNFLKKTFKGLKILKFLQLEKQLQKL
jgi:hypothetical protein